ncbi:MAG TPA: hypothetical protein VMM80_13345 [Bacteroidota bacterium]|nr:hypothetical protein [Bacteroidota bacterium]
MKRNDTPVEECMKRAFVLIAAVILCEGCGNNLAGPSSSSSPLRPPSNLQALALDSAHVRLTWTAAQNAADTSFRGYVVAWGSTADTIAKSAVQFTAGPLARGQATFQVRSLLTSGQASDAATITWAPAWRFDASPIVAEEFNSSLQSGTPGVSAGSATRNPAGVGFSDPSADSTMDFYLYGPAGGPLQLLSASVYNAGWHATFFSAQTTAAADLNTPLPAFPPDNTFALQAVTLSDNTVYYARISGNAGEVYYCRVHIHFTGGSFPNRTAEVRISLQKVPRLPYA